MIPFLMGVFAALCGWIQWGDKLEPKQIDSRKQDANYIMKVIKEDEKETMERKIKVIKDNGFDGYMTVEKYEIVSAPVEHTNQIPEKFTPGQVQKPSDMLYVPQPAYKMVRYNNPPGSPELSLKNSFYKNRQQNEQGIVSPDMTFMVYPAVYYYPPSGSVSCDLFVLPLDRTQGNLNRIMAAHVANKLPDPILSTDKSQDNYGTFRTLTPIDFSAGSTKLLVKEKTGNTRDGIWRTVPVVYDFEQKKSYRLTEVRDAIIHYWKTNRDIDLDDKRWDIYPLGFIQDGQQVEGQPPPVERVLVDAYAYTGRKPIHLGVWSVDPQGEQSRLMSFDKNDFDIPMHGIKIVQDGVVPASPKHVRASEGYEQWKIDRAAKKQKKEDTKMQIKALKKEYKANMKKMEKDFKEHEEYFDERNRITGSTSDMTKRAEKWEAKKAKLEEKAQKAKARQEAAEVKAAAREQKAREKYLQAVEKRMEKERTKMEKELDYIRSFPDPTPLEIPSDVFKE